MDIGIDLGTTHSVIGVKGHVALADSYLTGGGMHLECDVTIVPTPFGERTFPSVVWINPSDPQDVLIGIEALQKAQEEGVSPIMFSKRSIGTDELLPIYDYRLTAKQVATKILKYLKQCAERALGEVV